MEIDRIASHVELSLTELLQKTDEEIGRSAAEIEQSVPGAEGRLAQLVLDFLCIHPFRDGNGRVSRLLTLLALYQHGYEVGRYISLERLVEESREDYYEVRAGVRKGGMKDGTISCPGVSRDMVRRVLREFQKAGKVECLGRGPGAPWRRKGNVVERGSKRG